MKDTASVKVEKIIHNGQILAVVIYNQEINVPIEFYTPDESTLQVGRHKREAGQIIKAHQHVAVKVDRHEPLQEVLYIEQGKMKVSFYDDDGKAIQAKVLTQGDMILLICGGHGFQFLEDTKMIEIKQGPYNPNSRKAVHVKDKP